MVNVTQNVWIISIFGAFLLIFIDAIGGRNKLGNFLKNNFGDSIERQFKKIMDWIDFVGPIGAIFYLIFIILVQKVFVGLMSIVLSLFGILIGFLILYLYNNRFKKK